MKALFTTALAVILVMAAAPAYSQVPEADFFYDFETGSGEEILDQGPDAHHGEMFGDVVWENEGCIVSAAGESAGCIRYVEEDAFGTLSFVFIPYHDKFYAPDYTLSAWIKWKGDPDWGYVAWAGGPTWPEPEFVRHLDLYFNPRNRSFDSSIHDVTGEELRVNYLADEVNIDVFDNEWHQVTTTLENNRIYSMYVDGALVARDSVPAAQPIVPDGSSDLWLGARPNDADFQSSVKMIGLLDRVRFWDEALTAAQIQALHFSEGPESEVGERVATANFEVSPLFELAPATMTFDGSASAAPGSITSYEWDFGDETSGSGVSVEHTYTEPGAYLVTLTVTDDGGATGSLTKQVFVSEGLQEPIHWAFDGTGDRVIDVLGSEHELIITGAERISGGQTGEALQFNGERADLALAEDAAAYLNGLEAVTVALWAKADAIGSDRGLFITHLPVGGDGGLTLRYDASGANTGCTNCFKGAVRVRPDPDTEATDISFESASDVQTTDWQHLAVVWESGAPPQLFIDAQPVEVTASDTLEGHLFGLESLLIGKGGKDPDSAWEGLIDEFYIFPTAYDAPEIQQIMEGTLVSRDAERRQPARFAIEEVYPNPFNPEATAVVSIGEPGDYTLRVYNVLGQTVEQRSVAATVPGRLELSLQLGDQASGLYVVEVTHQRTGQVATAKAVLMK